MAIFASRLKKQFQINYFPPYHLMGSTTGPIAACGNCCKCWAPKGVNRQHCSSSWGGAVDTASGTGRPPTSHWSSINARFNANLVWSNSSCSYLNCLWFVNCGSSKLCLCSRSACCSCGQSSGSFNCPIVSLKNKRYTGHFVRMVAALWEFSFWL